MLQRFTIILRIKCWLSYDPTFHNNSENSESTSYASAFHNNSED